MSAAPIQNDPFIKQLKAKLPGTAASTFSDEQFLALKAALGGRSWGTHALDLRGTLSFWHWHYYFVFLIGRNRRSLSQRERELQTAALAAMALAFMVISTLFGLLILYLVKSAMGIDLIPGFSFGVWHWFKTEFIGG